MHIHYNLNLRAPFLQLPCTSWLSFIPACPPAPYAQPGRRMQRPKPSGPGGYTMLGATLM
jgi:hypothetical protein